MAQLRALLAITVLATSVTAHAGTGTKPAKIEAGLISVQHGIVQAEIIAPAGALAAVLELDATAVGNPEGITLIRGGNHKIPRGVAGKQLELLRAVGDAAGNVFVTYAAPNQQFGLVPITRRIKPDNTLGFEKTFNISRDAGIAADGSDGVYLASHVMYALPGEVIMTMVHHRTYRLSPSGDVLWQVEAAGQPTPKGASQFVTTATANQDGVFLGYGIGDGGDELGLVPVVGHRAASDGAELYTKVGLKKPAVAAAAALPAGSVGNQAMKGWVETIVIGSDGTAIADVHAQPSGHYVVRLDATGTQTDAYACNGVAREFAPGELACVSVGAQLSVTRFGIANDRLAIVGQWKVDAPDDTTFTTWAAAPGKRVLAAAKKNGRASLRLYSSTGALMTAWASQIDGTISELGAAQGAWLGYGPEHAPDWLRYAGTWEPGGTKPATSPRGAMPTR